MKVLGRTSIKRFIFQDLEEISTPAGMLVDPINEEVEAPQNPRFQIAKRMDLFVGRVGQVSPLSHPTKAFSTDSYQSYLDINRALSMNRSRTRRMLCHTVMDWDNIQLDVSFTGYHVNLDSKGAHRLKTWIPSSASTQRKSP